MATPRTSLLALALAIPLGTLGAAGCVGSGDSGSGLSGPGIAGSVGIGGDIGTAGTPIPNATPVAPVGVPAVDREFVPGDVIVKFRSSSQHKRARLDVAGMPVNLVRSLALPATSMYRVDGATREETLDVVAELSEDPSVLYAQPNYIFKPLAKPNDPGYPVQWHYPAIRLEQAWDITQGSDKIVVGVVDTGFLFQAGNAALSHPDFGAKVVPGFDFISNPQTSADGDGRDANALDPGTPGQQASYHGSHVGGTIGASTNDGVGLAGVDWNAKLLPVRALSDAGGTLADIMEGMMWAAGLPINGVPNNANPAQVINMSLGGPGQCSPAVQDAIQQATNAGAIIVVAAGNDNADAGLFTPASCTGVITVGATDGIGGRAPYSNFGTRVDVMAPGGNVQVDLIGEDNALVPDGRPDGVLSLSKDDQNGQFIGRFLNGTSMAAPHVAGVVSLMKAVNPDLTFDKALTILRNTAKPLSAQQCNRPAATDCGTGLIDAEAAVKAAAPDGVVPGIGGVAFTPDPADLGTVLNQAIFTLTNTKDASVDWRLENFTAAPTNPVAAPSDAIFLANGSAQSGNIAVGASQTLAIGINRGFANLPGTYAYTLNFTVGGESRPILFRFSQIAEGALPTGQMLVGALAEPTPGTFEVAGSQIGTSFLENYAFEVPAGEYIVLGWSDSNANGAVDAGDHAGVLANRVRVEANPVEGADFNVDPMLGNTALDSLPVPFEALQALFEAPRK